MSRNTRNVLEAKILDINLASNMKLELASENVGEKVLYTIYNKGKKLYMGSSYDIGKFMDGLSCGISIFQGKEYEQTESGNFVRQRATNSAVNKLLSQCSEFRVVAMKDSKDKNFSSRSRYVYIFKVEEYSMGNLKVWCTLRKQLTNNRLDPIIFNVNEFEIDVSNYADLRDFGLKLIKKADEIVYNKSKNHMDTCDYLGWLLWINEKRQREITGTYSIGLDTVAVHILSVGP